VETKKILHSLELDCLIFLEAMNTASMYFLGYQRFADVQVLVMGAPVTSGIASFDYFLSGELLEHPYRTQLKDEHYTEQVVLFAGQAISFPDEEHHPLQDAALAAGDANSNVTTLEQMTRLQKTDTHIYICFQSIQKIQPVFDSVLVDILQADPKAHIVLQASRHAAQTSALRNRLKETLQERLCGYDGSQKCSTQSFLSRIHFMARIPSDQVIDFFQRSGTSSVVLQPFPFDGSKTTSDALKAGIPLVTFPQPHLRGRMTSTLVRAMFADQVPNDIAMCCIADGVSDYVSKALRLTSDLQFRNRVSAAIQERSHRIFNNKSVSLEWGKFLTRALEQKISDQELEYEIGFGDEDRHYRSFSAKAIENDQHRWRKSVMLGHRSTI
jgi:protein O-GlcNAc transferase